MMPHRIRCLATLFVLAAAFAASTRAETTRPNILWFVVDDMSANFSCYGESLIETPNVDHLAKMGTRFTNAHVTAPVCSTCRSAFMTGMYQTSLGSQNHRMSLPPIQLPSSVEPISVLFQRAGYYTCNGDGLQNPSGRVRSKTDYNFVWDKSTFDGTDWSARKPGQPFFMQIQMAGGKLRGASMKSFESLMQTAKKTFGNNVDPARIQLPAYYPDDEVFRQDWAAYLESVRLTDHHVGQILSRLDSEGILDETLIIFMTDHGISHARGKQFNYGEGTHIPFVVAGPLANGKKADAGQVRLDFIEHIDMAAISLAAAGIPIPNAMQARDAFANDYSPRTSAFTARDRCDETIDFIRSLRTKDFLYIRNYNPFRPHLQPSRYKDNKVLLTRLRELRNEGQLTDLQLELLFSDSRPSEELYDLRRDPFETQNVVQDAGYSEQLADLRQRLNAQLLDIRDTGFLPEPTIANLCANQQSVYEFCSLPENYPLEEILDVADLAIQSDVKNLKALRAELQNPDPTLRYWAVLGLRMLGVEAAPARSELEALLKDPDASVRITSAVTLANWDSKPEMLTFLIREAEQAKHDAHALWALDAIKYLDTPQSIQGWSREQLVKGALSERAYDFLESGGLVFGNGINYWTAE